MHAVTGMIGATPAGERVHIAPGSAGRWPAWCGGRVEPIVWCISTLWVGAGFKPAPTMHAVTGMIGATAAGERVHIAPGSAGRWPAWCGARVDPIVSGGRFETCPHYACGDGHDRCDSSG